LKSIQAHVPEHEPGGDDLAGHVSQLELRGLEVGDGLLELLALLQKATKDNR
jgi:hypothetical protein